MGVVFKPYSCSGTVSCVPYPKPMFHVICIVWFWAKRGQMILGQFLYLVLSF